MPGRSKGTLALELPSNAADDNSQLIALLNDRLRQLSKAVSDLQGSNGPVKLLDSLDMQGHRVEDVADAVDGGDAVSRSYGDRRYLGQAQPQKPPSAKHGAPGSAEAVPFTAIIISPGPQAVASDVLANRYHVRIPPSLGGFKVKLYSVTVTAKVKPSTADSIDDVLVSHDSGATWLSLFGSTKAVLPKGAETVTLTPAWAVPFLLQDDQIRMDILAADGVVSGVELRFLGTYVPV